jgi:5-deoxy-D-glucuronate isomerase
VEIHLVQGGQLGPGEKLEADTGSEEVVFVPLVGRGKLSFGGKSYELHRKDLFRDRPDIAYLPPKTSYTLEAIDALEIALAERRPTENSLLESSLMIKLPPRFVEVRMQNEV